MSHFQVLVILNSSAHLQIQFAFYKKHYMHKKVA